MNLKFPKRIILEELEALWASFAGQLRCWDSTIAHYRSETYGSEREGTFERHSEGALAEYVVAKHLGLFWPGPGKLFDPNIPKTTQVCHTSRHDNKLIVHPDSDDNCEFWLVTGGKGDYYIEGWCYGFEAKLPKYWSDPGGYGRPAYFVPKSCLHDTYITEIDQLRAWNSDWQVAYESMKAKAAALQMQLNALKTKTPPA
jgi:hypothetical protein